MAVAEAASALHLLQDHVEGLARRSQLLLPLGRPDEAVGTLEDAAVAQVDVPVGRGPGRLVAPDVGVDEVLLYSLDGLHGRELAVELAELAVGDVPDPGIGRLVLQALRAPDRQDPGVRPRPARHRPHGGLAVVDVLRVHETGAHAHYVGFFDLLDQEPAVLGDVAAQAGAQQRVLHAEAVRAVDVDPCPVAHGCLSVDGRVAGAPRLGASARRPIGSGA